MRRESVFYAYLLCAMHHLFINLVNVSSRLHISGLVYLLRLRLQNGCATQRDVCVVIVQCSRSEHVPVAFI